MRLDQPGETAAKPRKYEAGCGVPAVVAALSSSQYRQHESSLLLTLVMNVSRIPCVPMRVAPNSSYKGVRKVITEALPHTMLVYSSEAPCTTLTK